MCRNTRNLLYILRICSFNNAGLGKTNSFGDDDDALTRFSPNREDESKKTLSCIPHDVPSKLDQSLRISVNDEIELANKNQATASTHRAGDSELRILELRFSSNITSPSFTGDHIKGVGGVAIEVILVDSHTKKQVKSGPEASGRVKIVVLKEEVDGDRKEYENILVRQMEGNRSCVSNVCVNLIEGIAHLPLVSFTHNSTWRKISECRLEASFIDNFDGVRVKEAQMEPFILKDRRNSAKKKHSFPSLHDEVWRLKKIGRNGPLATSLIQAKIETVKDFIVRLFLHPLCLTEEEAERRKTEYSTTIVGML